jgi:hypothetical protein
MGIVNQLGMSGWEKRKLFQSNTKSSTMPLLCAVSDKAGNWKCPNR